MREDQNDLSKPNDTESKKKRSLLRMLTDEFEYLAAYAALVLLVVLLTCAIVARYVVGESIPWAEEVSRILFFVVVFSSISYAARERRHLRVTLFVDKLVPDNLKRYFYAFGDCIWTLFNVAVIFASIQVIIELIEYPYLSAVLGIPMHYVYAIIPLFYLTLSARIIHSIIDRLTGKDSEANELSEGELP